MTDLELLVIGATVTFMSVAGAYVAIRHRANELPVDSYKTPEDRHRTQRRRSDPTSSSVHAR